jgi:hypothetical protein
MIGGKSVKLNGDIICRVQDHQRGEIVEVEVKPEAETETETEAAVAVEVSAEVVATVEAEVCLGMRDPIILMLIIAVFLRLYELPGKGKAVVRRARGPAKEVLTVIATSCTYAQTKTTLYI